MVQGGRGHIEYRVQLGGGQPEVFFGGAPFVQSAHVSLLHTGGSGLAESQVQSVVHAALPADGDGQTPLAGQAAPPGQCSGGVQRSGGAGCPSFHQFEMASRMERPSISMMDQMAVPAQPEWKYAPRSTGTRATLGQ